MKHHILLVDDEELQRKTLAGFLRKQGYLVSEAASGTAALKLFDSQKIDAVLSDQRMPEMGGQELLEKIHSRNPEISVLLMTAFGSIEDAVKAMRNGAFGYITKPVDLESLAQQLKRALKHRELLSENRSLRERLQHYEAPGVVGDSTVMREVYSMIARVAPTDTTVLILGESGTGKELAARGIHQLSHRNNAPFVAVNVAAIPESLLESELFGHEKGAFTGASQQRIGVVERANGGTLFIDEVGDMPASAQLKLLRMLQERVIERVGGNGVIPVDLRILAATHRRLEQCVADGEFRQDLYYRLNVVQIELPPLRDRRSDLKALARHLLDLSCQRLGRGQLEIDPHALDSLLAHDWPGNVRELANVMERAAVLCRGDAITVEDLRLDGSKTLCSATSWLDRDDLPLPRRLELLEREVVLKALETHNGNRSAAARQLGISEKNIRDRLRRWQETLSGTPIARAEDK